MENATIKQVDLMGIRTFELTENVRDIIVSLRNGYLKLKIKEANKPVPNLDKINVYSSRIKYLVNLDGDSEQYSTLEKLELLNNSLTSEYNYLNSING